jgi:hypothetical protein
MDHYSILGSGTPSADGAQDSPAPPLSPAPPAQKKAGELRFPAEDGGRSLVAWARRDLEATLQLLADRAQYITGASGAAIALRDGEHIICRASSGPSAPEIGSFLEVSTGLSGESVRTRKTLRCDDANTDPRVNHESCRALGIASFAVMPLVRQDEVIGIVEIFGSKVRAFGERDLLALQRMGEMINTALDQVGDAPLQPPAAAAPRAGAAELQLEDAEDEPGFFSQSAHPAAPASAKPEPAQAELAKPELAKPEPPRKAAIETLFEKLPPPSPQAPPHSQPQQAQPAELDPARLALINDLFGSKPAASGEHTIRKCRICAFPISVGRTLCLDCEAKHPKSHSAPEAAPVNQTPAFLNDLLSEKAEDTSGLKRWLLAHRYLLATIVVVGGTIVILLTR